jgi:hypothetical protein
MIAPAKPRCSASYMQAQPAQDVSALLRVRTGGDDKALDRLLPVLYRSFTAPPEPIGGARRLDPDLLPFARVSTNVKQDEIASDPDTRCRPPRTRARRRWWK